MRLWRGWHRTLFCMPPDNIGGEAHMPGHAQSQQAGTVYGKYAVVGSRPVQGMRAPAGKHANEQILRTLH